MRYTKTGRRLAVLPVLICLLLASHCAFVNNTALEKNLPAMHIVRFEGVAESCYTYPPSFMVRTLSEGPHAVPLALPVREGEVLSCDNDKLIFPFHESDGNVLHLEKRDTTVFLNGKAVSVSLTEDGKGLEWLQRATPADLVNLRMLIVASNLEKKDYPIVEKLARAQPNLGLFFQDNVQPELIAEILSRFEPRFLAVDAAVLTERTETIKPALAGVETLWLIKVDGDSAGGASLDFLSRLPLLHTLLLSEWDPRITGELPKGMHGLRSLTLMQCEVRDLTFLHSLNGLQELNLWAVDKLENISSLADMPGLRKLVLLTAKDKVKNLSVLDKLPHLTWLALPENISQEEFNNVVEHHPELEGIELNSVNLADLSPLRQLPDLRAAVLLQGNFNTDVLKDLRGLRFLALPKEAFTGADAEKTAALVQQLPAASIVPAQPFCLGSGWILLLAPLVMFLYILVHGQQHSRSKMHA